MLSTVLRKGQKTNSYIYGMHTEDCVLPDDIGGKIAYVIWQKTVTRDTVYPRSVYIVDLPAWIWQELVSSSRASN